MRGLPGWLFVLFVVLLAAGTDEFVIAGVLPEVGRDLGVPVAAAGQLVTAFAVVYALGAPLLSLITDRLPRRAVMVAGLVVFTLANALAALAPGYAVLLTARVLSAVGAAVVTSAAFAVAAEGAPEGRQGRYLSVVVAGITVALFTGVPLGAWLAGAYGWRSTFWLITAVGAVAAVAVRATAPDLPGGAAAPLRERLAPLRSLPVVRLLGVTFVGATGGLMFYSYLAPYVADVADRTAQEARPLVVGALFLVGVTGVAGALLGGRAVDVWGPHRTLRRSVGGHVLAMAAAAGVGLAGPGGGGVWVLAGLVLVVGAWSVVAWAFNPPAQGVLMGIAPQAATTAMALNISAMYLGTGVGSALGGLILKIGGGEAAWVPAVATVLLAGSYGLARRVAADAPAPAPGPGPGSAPGPAPTSASCEAAHDAA
ncbi:MFS transporter [Streptomyces sp. NPDC048172]|uniref:MFS transporter n=1 Tax=Streptomyces sp. NPDC048172 TaxID=3365505 RepID=UPI00371B29F0